MIEIDRDSVKPGDVFTFLHDVHGQPGAQYGVVARIEDGIVYAVKWVERQQRWTGLRPVRKALHVGGLGFSPVGEPPLGGKVRSDARKEGKRIWMTP